MANPKCAFAEILVAVEREIEPHAFRALRKTLGKVEAVLTLYCRECDCFHATILHARAGEDDADAQAYEAVLSTLRLIAESVEQKEAKQHGIENAETETSRTIN